MPYYEGRLLYRFGLVHAQRDAPEEARKHLEAARAIFHRLGARPYRERTEHALAKM
jgi:hypothetical protein